LLKKEFLIVIGLFAVVSILAINISNRHAQIEIVYPEHDTVLSEEDYQIDTGNGILKAGQSSWDEAQQIYPRGKELGRSTIYEPEDRQCLLTFTRNENILTIIHIDGSKLSTSRGIKKGDTADQIELEYGKNYTIVKKVVNNKDFDMIYGKNRENSVIFQLRNDKVERIIIQREVQK
jgi:hypothetical protein